MRPRYIIIGLNSSPAHFPWSIQCVQPQIHPPLNTADYISPAISSFNDYFVISYYGTTNHSLIASTPISNHAENCGTRQSWLFLSIDGGIGLAAGMFTQ
jgi:hypothetical protein